LPSLTTQYFNMGTPGSVSSRCRLYGLQVSFNTATTGLTQGVNGWMLDGAGSTRALDFDKMIFEFKDGSASGDVLFSFVCPLGTTYGAPQNAMGFMFKHGSILFPNGLHLESIGNNNEVVPEGLIGSAQGVTIFYET